MITKSLINLVELLAGMGTILKVIWDAADWNFNNFFKKILRLDKVLKGEEKIFHAFQELQKCCLCNSCIIQEFQSSLNI